MAARQVRLKALHALYTRHESLDGGACIYCGDVADSEDHLPPLVMAYANGPSAFKELLLVRSCRDCNSRLSSRPLFTVKERKNFIAERLRFFLTKTSEPWTDDEKDELGPTLRKFIEQHEVMRMILKRRLSVASGYMSYRWRSYEEA